MITSRLGNQEPVGQSRKEDDSKRLAVLAGIAALVCVTLLVAYWLVDKHAFVVDNNVLILFFASLTFVFLPFFSKIKIGSFLEAERLQRQIEQVQEMVIRGEVVETENDRIYYIAGDGSRYAVPDDETAAFLKSSKGILRVSNSILDSYPLAGTLDSVRECPLVKWDVHLYAILGGRKYHIGSASFLADWGRTMEEFTDWDDQKMRLVPTGR